MLVFLDVCVAANAAANLGGVYDTAGWTTSHPGATWGLQVLTRALAAGATLATSTTWLETLRRTLSKSDASDFDALDDEGARASCASYAALARQTGGVVVDTADVAARIAGAKAVVARERHGHGAGQIDHEDFTVLAGVKAAIDQTGAPGAVLVTADQGLIACARDLVRWGIIVMAPRQFLAMRAAA